MKRALIVLLLAGCGGSAPEVEEAEKSEAVGAPPKAPKPPANAKSYMGGALVVDGDTLSRKGETVVATVTLHNAANASLSNDFVFEFHSAGMDFIPSEMTSWQSFTVGAGGTVVLTGTSRNSGAAFYKLLIAGREEVPNRELQRGEQDPRSN